MYVDDVIIKSRDSSGHSMQLRKFFVYLGQCNINLNPTIFAFGVPTSKLLGFIVSKRGFEFDPSKIKAIQHLPPPKMKKEVMSFLWRLNYISRFISQYTIVCKPNLLVVEKICFEKLG